MKYAIVESGGKQYVAREGESFAIDRQPLEVGDRVIFDEVLLLVDDGAPTIGKPYIEGAKVQAEVEAHFRAPKIIVYKFKPKVRYRRKQGHRQHHTRVLVKRITAGGVKRKKAKAETTKAGAVAE
jgi:large subunit ribosomal protein L21